MYGLAGLYDNPIPTQFLAPLGYLKIPAQITFYRYIEQVMVCWSPLLKGHGHNTNFFMHISSLKDPDTNKKHFEFFYLLRREITGF